MKRPQMIWAVAVAVLGMRLAAFAEEAYIASTTKGPVYSIDTGYKIGPTTGVYADFEFIARTADVFPANTYQQFVFEAGGGGAARFYINGTTGNGALAWNFTKEYVWSSTGVTMVPGTRYQMSVDAFTRSAWLDVAGVRSYTANFAANTTVPNYTETIKLFSGTGGGRQRCADEALPLHDHRVRRNGARLRSRAQRRHGGHVRLDDRRVPL